jgi:hypothetical protein
MLAHDAGEGDEPGDGRPANLVVRHDRGMADEADKRNEIEKLLAEVDRVVDGKPSRDRSSGGHRPAKDFGPSVTARARAAALSGAVAAVVVWAIFAVLPFLDAFSGAAGAFLATFAAVLVLRWRR